MTRACKVKAHVRKLPDRLDTEKHRKLATEIGFVPRGWIKPRVRVAARSRTVEG
jgi:hypothetical protein